MKNIVSLVGILLFVAFTACSERKASNSPSTGPIPQPGQPRSAPQGQPPVSQPDPAALNTAELKTPSPSDMENIHALSYQLMMDTQTAYLAAVADTRRLNDYEYAVAVDLLYRLHIRARAFEKAVVRHMMSPQLTLQTWYELNWTFVQFQPYVTILPIPSDTITIISTCIGYSRIYYVPAYYNPHFAALIGYDVYPYYPGSSYFSLYLTDNFTYLEFGTAHLNVLWHLHPGHFEQCPEHRKYIRNQSPKYFAYVEEMQKTHAYVGINTYLHGTSLDIAVEVNKVEAKHARPNGYTPPSMKMPTIKGPSSRTETSHTTAGTATPTRRQPAPAPSVNTEPMGHSTPQSETLPTQPSRSQATPPKQQKKSGSRTTDTSSSVVQSPSTAPASGPQHTTSQGSSAKPGKPTRKSISGAGSSSRSSATPPKG